MESPIGRKEMVFSRLGGGGEECTALSGNTCRAPRARKRDACRMTPREQQAHPHASGLWDFSLKGNHLREFSPFNLCCPKRLLHLESGYLLPSADSVGSSDNGEKPSKEPESKDGFNS